MYPEFHVATQGHVVPLVYPVNLTGGKTGVEFNMGQWSHASVIVLVGVSAAAFTKIIVNECTNAAGAGATPIAHRIYKCETADSDVLGAAVAVLAAGTTPSATDNIFYIIEVDAAELSEGYNWVQVVVTNGANNVEGAIVAILSGGRYAGEASATVIA